MQYYGFSCSRARIDGQFVSINLMSQLSARCPDSKSSSLWIPLTPAHWYSSKFQSSMSHQRHLRHDVIITIAWPFLVAFSSSASVIFTFAISPMQLGLSANSICSSSFSNDMRHWDFEAPRFWWSGLGRLCLTLAWISGCHNGHFCFQLKLRYIIDCL